MLRHQFLFSFQWIIILIDVKVMDKGKESLHNKMGFLILYSIKSNMFAWLEDVVAVVIKNALQLL